MKQFFTLFFTLFFSNCSTVSEFQWFSTFASVDLFYFFLLSDFSFFFLFCFVLFCVHFGRIFSGSVAIFTSFDMQPEQFQCLCREIKNKVDFRWD